MDLGLWPPCPHQRHSARLLLHNATADRFGEAALRRKNPCSTGSNGPGAGVASPAAISTATCKVNEHCVGDHWTVGNFELLARLI
jgi:hypothetical protein